MGGGVNPLEWVMPPVAITHMGLDTGARQFQAGVGGNPEDVPSVPNSPAAAQKKAADDAEAARIAAQDRLRQQQKQAAFDLAARTETPQEALDARRRAQISAERLGGGKRRASQTLTDPGMTLSGSYP